MEWADLLPQILKNNGWMIMDSCNSGNCVDVRKLVCEDWHIMTRHSPYERTCCLGHLVEDRLRGVQYIDKDTCHPIALLPAPDGDK